MGNDMEYDSRGDTLEHIHTVQMFMNQIIHDLLRRALDHDASKLHPPEKAIFDAMTPRLSGVTYGSDEYRSMLNEMRPAIDHHNKHNRHHPEHHAEGLDDMSLMDVIEMFCDWKAATRRHDDGDIYKSIEINHERFTGSQLLKRIFINTAKRLGW